MKPSEEVIKKRYQHLGYLFYAIAAADRNIRQQEIGQLKQIVKKEWVNLEDTTDEFGTDAAFQIEIVFDWLTEDYGDAQDCFNHFKFYYKEHEYLFNKSVKKLVLKTVHAIADSFAGSNKAEKGMIQQLEDLFK